MLFTRDYVRRENEARVGSRNRPTSRVPDQDLQELPTGYKQLSETGRSASCYYQVFTKTDPNPSSARKSTDFPVASGTKSTRHTVTHELRAVVGNRLHDPVLITRNQTTQPDSAKRSKHQAIEIQSLQFKRSNFQLQALFRRLPRYDRRRVISV